MLKDLLAPISELLSKFVPDKDQAAKLAHEVATMAQKHAHEEVKAQLEINKEAAKHPSIFVAGMRPAAGWIAVFGFAYSVLLQPITNGILIACGLPAVFPAIDNGIMLYVLGGLLGLSGLRTWEKFAGVARNNLKE